LFDPPHPTKTSSGEVRRSTKPVRNNGFSLGVNTKLRPHSFGWLESPEEIWGIVETIVRDLGPIAVGIDAPRYALDSPRSHYWDGGKWRPRRPWVRGYGRHCEIVIAALRLANPQVNPWLPSEMMIADKNAHKKRQRLP